MLLYIIRHGDPDYENDTLTEYGWLQAEKLAKRMGEIKPDKIYTSPRGRAIATAKPTCELLGMRHTVEEWTTEKMEYMIWPDAGDETALQKGWETNIADGIFSYSDYAKEDRSEHINGLIESSGAFLLRHGYKREGLRYKITSPNDQKVAVYCHGGFGGAWICHLLSLPPAMGWMHFSLFTTSVTLFRFENTESGYTYPRCLFLNDTTHLL